MRKASKQRRTHHWPSRYVCAASWVSSVTRLFAQQQLTMYVLMPSHSVPARQSFAKTQISQTLCLPIAAFLELGACLAPSPAWAGTTLSIASLSDQPR